MVPGVGRRGSVLIAFVTIVETDTELSSGNLWFGAVVRTSESFASSSARLRARSDSPPSALACSRQAIRLTSQALLPVRVSSPNTSAYFAFSCWTVIFRRAVTSFVMFRCIVRVSPRVSGRGNDRGQ